MLDQEKVIKLFITTNDISNERCDFHCIVNGIENLFDIVDRLKFNGSDSIFVHLVSPISSEQMNHKLILLCKLMEDEGLVNSARLSRMGLPMDGGRFYTSFDDNNLLKNERYMITFTK